MNIDSVKNFWNENPLWTGESQFTPGTKEFFEEHRQVYIQDCFAGQLDPHLFPANKNLVLDLGCGVGFWTIEFCQRRYPTVYGADLSEKSLDLAKKRLQVYGYEAQLHCENAEALSFADNYFDHVNCQGVIHHTVTPENVIKEIHRTLKPGATAVISVYYKNIILRNIKYFSPFISLWRRLGRTLMGRGREQMFDHINADEIIRKYDGDTNPIGRGYTKSEFIKLLGPHFEIEDIYYHFFPKRALAPFLSNKIHKLLDKNIPFMIYANVKKR